MLVEMFLLNLNKVLMSQKAPTETKFFRNDEDKIVRYKKKLGDHHWSNKQIRIEAHKLYRGLIEDYPQYNVGNVEGDDLIPVLIAAAINEFDRNKVAELCSQLRPYLGL